VKSLIESDYYQQLVEDCRAILTERSFNARMEIVIGYHELGKRIATDPLFRKFGKGNKQFIENFAKDLKISPRSIYYAIRFYEKFPTLQQLPEGKNISWYGIVRKYLTDGKEKEKREKKVVKCPKCGFEFTP